AVHVEHRARDRFSLLLPDRVVVERVGHRLVEADLSEPRAPFVVVHTQTRFLALVRRTYRPPVIVASRATRNSPSATTADGAEASDRVVRQTAVSQPAEALMASTRPVASNAAPSRTGW